jgi:hypothetical protein
MEIDREGLDPHCPSCGRALEWLGSEDVGLDETIIQRAHAYVCPAGCRSQSPDGTFEFVECPLCGSRDTCCAPTTDGPQELQCNTCGAVVTVQLHSGSP